MKDIELTLENVGCIKEVSNFTNKIVHNICTGESTQIELGALDILVTVWALVLLASVMILLFSAAIKALVTIGNKSSYIF